MTVEKNNAEVLDDAELDAVDGGYVKIAEPGGLGKVVDSFELAGKRDIGTGAKPLPSEGVTLGYTEVEWTY